MSTSLKLGNLEKGLFIYEDIFSSLAEKKYVQYKKEDLETYKDKFEELVGDGVFIENCLFDDLKWIVYGRNNYLTLDFSETEYNTKVYLPLKCFIVTQLYDRRLVVDSVYSGLIYILHIVKITGAYDKRFLKGFIDFMEIKDIETKHMATFYKSPNLAFLFFNPINNCKDYIDVFINIKSSSNFGEVRQIPTYSNFILFDAIITDFMAKTSPYLREKYYPIFIWWRLTSVIPIRPMEFREILNKGIRYDSEEDVYYILIPRRKQYPDPINKNNGIDIQHELKMNKEMYDIITDYKKLANIEHEKYLFPITAYTKFLRREDMSIKLRHYSDFISGQQLSALLDNFFDKVIKDKYGTEIVNTREELNLENEYKTIKRFKIGDTRHMAICMMMMQGFSELTIAQMAGHKNIKTQSHYSSHIDDFQRSYSGLLVRNITQRLNNGESELNNFNFRQKQLLSYTLNDNLNARKIEFGYCHSKNFPYECFSKECIFCNKFQIDLLNISQAETQDLMNKVTKIQDEIQIKLNFIKKYYSTAFKRKNEDKNNNENEIKVLKNNANNLNILLNRKAMVEAHLNKFKEIKNDSSEE